MSPIATANPESIFTMDEIIDDIMLHLLPNASDSSARSYWEAAASMMSGSLPFYPMSTPAGISMFPKEQLRLSHRWAEARFKNLTFFQQ